MRKYSFKFNNIVIITVNLQYMVIIIYLFSLSFLKGQTIITNIDYKILSIFSVLKVRGREEIGFWRVI
ncbi:MAG TPA: hypothetical protein DDW17_04645 [Deltaproteobacteria bacterium]|nr:hypothetical protein [Deltaproteobacteria bacterium]